MYLYNGGTTEYQCSTIGRFHPTRYRYTGSAELLTPDNTGTIEFVLQRFKPNSNSGDAVQSHEGEEVFFVLKGQLVLFLDQMELVLNQGDSVRIPAKTPHFWVNQTDSEVEVIFAITPPAF